MVFRIKFGTLLDDDVCILPSRCVQGHEQLSGLVPDVCTSINTLACGSLCSHQPMYNDIDCLSAVVLLDLPAHKVVTGSMSNHFRKRLMQFEQQQQRDLYAKGIEMQAPNNMQLDIKLNDSPRERLVAAARMAAPGVAILDEIIPADWLPAAEVVLKFMYTQELAKPDNVMLLITVSSNNLYVL